MTGRHRLINRLATNLSNLQGSIRKGEKAGAKLYGKINKIPLKL